MGLEEIKTTVDSTLWVEKYKPLSIDDVLMENSLKLKFEEYIRNKDIPCLLFSGNPGNGKTTCAKLIAKEISNNVMFINASNESGIDTVRNKIEPFCVTQPLESGMKIIILDEMEMSSENFQTALREMIEKFYSTTRFILTCNFINKVIEPLKSRSQEYKFGNINQLDVLKRCLYILDNEKVEYDKKNVVKVIKNLGSDLRRIINTLQKLTVEKEEKKVLESFTTLDEQKNLLLDLVKQKKLSEFRKKVGESNLNADEIVKFLFNKAFEQQISEKNWVEIVAELSETAYRLKIGVDPEISLLNGISQIMQLL